MVLFWSRTVWMEQPVSCRRKNLCSFQGSLYLQLRAPLSSTGEHGAAVCLEPVAQMASFFPRPLRWTPWHCRHRQGQQLAALCQARKTLALCPHSQRQKKESGASQLLLPTAVTPLLRDRGPAPPLVPDASHHKHSPIRKSMYPSPPLSTRTFFSFCPSVSVAAVLGFSEGLSNTLPFRVARTLPVEDRGAVRASA